MKLTADQTRIVIEILRREIFKISAEQREEQLKLLLEVLKGDLSPETLSTEAFDLYDAYQRPHLLVTDETSRNAQMVAEDIRTIILFTLEKELLQHSQYSHQYKYFYPANSSDELAIHSTDINVFDEDVLPSLIIRFSTLGTLYPAGANALFKSYQQATRIAEKLNFPNYTVYGENRANVRVTPSNLYANIAMCLEFYITPDMVTLDTLYNYIDQLTAIQDNEKEQIKTKIRTYFENSNIHTLRGLNVQNRIQFYQELIRSGQPLSRVMTLFALCDLHQLRVSATGWTEQHVALARAIIEQKDTTLSPNQQAYLYTDLGDYYFQLDDPKALEFYALVIKPFVEARLYKGSGPNSLLLQADDIAKIKALTVFSYAFAKMRACLDKGFLKDGHVYYNPIKNHFNEINNLLIHHRATVSTNQNKGKERSVTLDEIYNIAIDLQYMMAVAQGSHVILRHLIQTKTPGATNQVLHQAAYHGRIEAVKMLVEQGKWTCYLKTVARIILLSN